MDRQEMEEVAVLTFNPRRNKSLKLYHIKQKEAKWFEGYYKK